MKKKITRIAVVAALGAGLVLAGGSSAQAGHCDGAPIDLGGIYLDVRHVADDENLWSIWMYAENGIAPGLQRGGSQVAFQASGFGDIATLIGETDNCGVYDGTNDYLIF